MHCRYVRLMEKWRIWKNGRKWNTSIIFLRDQCKTIPTMYANCEATRFCVVRWIYCSVGYFRFTNRKSVRLAQSHWFGKQLDLFRVVFRFWRDPWNFGVVFVRFCCFVYIGRTSYNKYWPLNVYTWLW